MTEELIKLETNIDDCTGEALGFVIQMLLDGGALDAWATPIIMKKGRPAYMLSVLCDHDHESKMEDLIFHHTTSIGIRKISVYRDALPRSLKTIKTPYGPATVKLCTHHDHTYIYPEYDSVQSICASSGLSFQQVSAMIADAAKDL